MLGAWISNCDVKHGSVMLELGVIVIQRPRAYQCSRLVAAVDISRALDSADNYNFALMGGLQESLFEN